MRRPTYRWGGKLTVVTGTLLALAGVGATAAVAGPIPGVDTSHYQHKPSLNWSKVRGDGVRFAFLKATEGSTFKDPYFAADWAATKAAGIYRGAYHFGRPSVGSAARQATYFASVIGSQKGRGTLPPVLDLEATGGLGKKQLVTWTRNFLQETERLTGRTPIIYVSPAFWEYWLGNSSAFTRYPLWIANYGVSSPRVPGGWKTWTFWQSTSSGNVQGISGRVDKDQFNGTLRGLRKLALAYDPLATTLTLGADDPAPMTGHKVGFTGTLTDPSGAAVANRTVTLSSSTDDTTWTTVGTSRTDATGAYDLDQVVTSAASYRASFAGDSDFLATSSPVLKVTLTPTPTKVSFKAPKTTALAGQTLEFHGGLFPLRKMAGRNVTIAVMPVGSQTWHRVASLVTDDKGHFRGDVRVVSTGSYRATFSGDVAYASAASVARDLDISLNPSDLSFAVANSAPYAEHRVRMVGSLLTDGRPVAGRTVVISRQLVGATTWHPVITTRTDAQGRYVVRTPVDRAASYRAVFRADQLFQTAVSSPQAVTITPPTRVRLALLTTRDKVKRGHVLALHGTLLDTAGAAVADHTVQIWRRALHSRVWHLVGRTTTRVNGHWRYRARPPHDCVYQARVRDTTRWAGDHTTRLRVRLR